MHHLEAVPSPGEFPHVRVLDGSRTGLCAYVAGPRAFGSTSACSNMKELLLCGLGGRGMCLPDG
jgi:hypothetical protein